MKRYISLLAVIVLGGCDALRLEPELTVVGVEVEPRDTLILEGDTIDLRVTVRNSFGGVMELPSWRQPVFSTTDTKIVGIDEQRVYGAGGGEGEIQVSVAGLKATAKINVNPMWDVKATHAYITQVAQNPFEPVPSITGRQGLLRVFLVLDEFHRHDPPDMQITLFSGSPLLDTTLTQAFPKVLSTLDESQFAFSYNLLIPFDIMTQGLVADIIYDPMDRQRGVGGQERITFEMAEAPVFKQRFVPIISTARLDLNSTEWVNAQSDDSPDLRMPKILLPIGARIIEPGEPLYTDYDPFESSYAEWVGVLSDLGLRRQTDRAWDWHYYGVLDLPDGYVGIAGIADLGGVTGVGRRETDRLTYTHEVGHMMNLHHAPCPPHRPPPGPDRNFPTEDGSIGGWGWHPITGSLVEPTTNDVMGYCRNQWISWYSFGKALDYRMQRGRDIVAANEPVLYVWGGVDGYGALQLEPAMLIEAPASVPDERGTHRVEGHGPSGEIVFSHRFTPNVVTHTAWQRFGVAIPYEPGQSPPLTAVSVSSPTGRAVLREGSHDPVALVFYPGTDRLMRVQRNWDGRMRPSDGRRIWSTGLPEEATRR